MKDILKPNKIVAIVCYLLLYLIGSSLIMIAFIYFDCMKYDFSFLDYSQSLASIDEESIYFESYSKISANTQFVTYLLMAIFVCFFMRNHLKEDAIKTKNNWLFTLIFTVVICGIFYGISELLTFITNQITDETSTNQNAIVGMIQYGNPIINFFSIVILAPIVEELIYRKCVFEFLSRKKVYISYIVSTILFSVPHMLSTESSVGVWCLLALSYVIPGACLCFAYHKGKNNVYVSFAIHMMNNLIAFILLVL